MTPPRHARIGAAFGAAHDYDRHARIQAQCAADLAATIAALPLPGGTRLEIGCGTGFLTAALAPVPGEWLVTDLAPAMLARAQARAGDLPGRRFAPLNGELSPRPGQGPIALICSNLAFQWFDDLAAAVRRLAGWLAPGGWIAFTTLADGTFAEWRAAHAAAGAAPGTPPYPADAAIAALLPGAQVSFASRTQQHRDARDFLHAVKAIGAGTPAPDHRPLSPGQLRRVMQAFERDGARATYRVATVLWQRPAA